MLGIIIKTVLNIPLISWLQGNGSVLATALGYSASILYMFIMIKRHAGYSFRRIFKRFILIGILTAIMAVVAYLTSQLVSQVISYEGGIVQAGIVILISMITGGGVYMFLSYKVGDY
ncbi:hypothetical protein BsIDN1_52780 [Bacillus safensis]|uniref:Uncharacterized protein n=1 Tax=Bacillus safensis TaxID=561879 RepID=A0A5S9MDU2_BACIA|nr:hypothetical protein BsIDN1_52780 [Bacillus safensis]